MPPRARCCLVLAVLLVPFVPASAAARGSAQQQTGVNPYFEFLMARRLLGEGDAKGAQAALERAMAADPESAEIRAEMASFFLRQDRFEDAEKSARDALVRDSESIEAHRVLGLLYTAYADSAVRGPEVAKVPSYLKEAIEHLEKVVPTAAGATDISAQYNLGRLYLRNGDLDKAIETLSRVVDQNPYWSQARLALAQAQSDSNQGEAAIETLKPAVEEEPRLNATLGQFYERAGRYTEAADAYTKALAVTPTSRDLKLRLASVLLSAPSRENAAKAVEVLSSLVQQNPKDVRALYLRSQAHRGAGDLTAAENDARAAMAADRTSVSGAYALAQVLAQRHRNNDVITLLEPIVAAPGRGGEIVALLQYLSFAYQSVGDHQKAIDALVRAQTLTPDDATIDLYLIQAYIGAKKYAEAAAFAAEAQKRHPSQQRFSRLHARALFRSGAASRALALLEASVKANPDDSDAYVALADLYADAGRVDEGIRLLDRAGERFPQDSSVPFQQGSILEKADRFSDAERAFQRALDLEPDHADALNYLGYMLAERGQRLDEAVRFVTRALELDPDNPSYLDSLGWAQFKRGDLAQAEQNLTRAAAALPRNSVIQDHLGDLLARLGRPKDAASAWTRALEGDGEELNRAGIERKIRDIQRRR